MESTPAAPDGAIPVDRPERQERRRVAGFWLALFSGTAAANVLVRYMRAARDHEAFDWFAGIVDEGSSALVSLLLLAVLIRLAARWPLHADTWRRLLPSYLIGALAWWLLHVGGMVALRQLAHAVVGGQYRYGPWPTQWLYELFKDLQTYAILVSAVHALAWFGRRRQGEATLLAAPDEGVPVEPVERPAHFLVRTLGKEFLLATADIEYAQAASNYVNLHVRGHDYPLRITLAALEARLDPAVFLRCHRSWLVNRACLRSIEPLDGGEALLHMADGARLPCSRRQLPLLRQALGGG
ncbi:LytTR family DNA-binding domain-containing protein [Stenotrophomonas sp. CFBP8980]|uniref:LytTR family DNA-binding domain-containing protein n=1 Tax=Stenotrophomonas sp. CFBP8980 TaxID=3096523 RepID=UPI002A6A4C4B|nr:LytTR family DNA-binding domain-containing protein [Stenotrophomonas sp. CFBP8980]MDY1034626.1 LytTR family DNA-binding domain-containing protein [Stenotrophomonas sp. CFBP8980]